MAATDVQQHPTRQQKPSTPPPVKEGFHFYRTGLKYGLAVGAVMGLYLVFITMGKGDPEPILQFIQYVLLFFVVGYAIYRYRDYVPVGGLFQQGAMFSAYMSAVAAVTVAVINFIAYLINPGGMVDPSASELSGNAGNFSNFMITDSILFVSVFVYGMLSAFIWLQFLKRSSKPHVEQ